MFARILALVASLHLALVGGVLAVDFQNSSSATRHNAPENTQHNQCPDIITQTAAGVVSGDLDIGEMLKGAAFAGLGAGALEASGCGVGLSAACDAFTARASAVVSGAVDTIRAIPDYPELVKNTDKATVMFVKGAISREVYVTALADAGKLQGGADALIVGLGAGSLVSKVLKLPSGSKLPIEVSAPVTLTARTWQKFEQAIADLYGPKLTQTQRTTTLIVDGKAVTIIADNVTMLRGAETAIEAKFVNSWSTSIRNPNSPIGSRDFALAEQQKMVTQARNYAQAYPGGVVYHTNSPELAAHYSAAFDAAGISNYKFIITPVK